MSAPLIALPPMAQVLDAFGVRLVGDGTQQIRCPVHQDKSPSARYYANEQRVYCFTCGRGWDALGVVMGRLKYDRHMAMAWLRARFQFVEPSLADKMRAGLRSTAAPIPAAARLQHLDAMVRAQAPDFLTAVRWWTAIDYLQGLVEAGENVDDKVAQLRAHMGVG